MNDNLTLEELEKLSGLPIRTIRYYIQAGLLWGPDTRGKFATYSQEHLERLELISVLKERTHLPLEEIRKLLDHASPEQLQQIREIMASSIGKVVIIDTDKEETSPRKAGEKALEYLNNISWVQSGIKEASSPALEAMEAPDIDSAPWTPQENPSRWSTRKENWQRINLYEGVELHIRAPRDRKSDSKITELIEFARKLFRG